MIIRSRFILLLSAVVLSISLTASPVSLQQAQQQADAFFASVAPQHRAQAQSLRLAYTAMQPKAQVPAFYVFNRGTDGGFVLVAADDAAASPVLGYAESGTFLTEDMPANVAYWLERFAASVEYAASCPQSASARQRMRNAYTPVAPLMQTKWNQGYPFNLKCPMDGQYQSLTGCIATAFAQVMKYHAYPEHGNGSHSYTWSGGYYSTPQTLSADFGNTTYEWSSMRNTTNYTWTSKQENAVSTIMYHLGVACEMKYSAAASGSYAEDMAAGMYRYFDYDSSLQVICKDYFPALDFLDIIQEELLASRPLVVEGHTPRGEGHCFVCDGIDADGYVHINWGWSGVADGNFDISNLAPEEQGAGGALSGMAFTESVVIIRGIQPNQGGRPRPTIISNSITLDRYRMAKTESPVITCDWFVNFGACDWSGRLMALVYDSRGTLLQALSDDPESTEIPVLYGGDQYSISPSFSQLPVGQYDVMIGVSMDGQSEYFPVYAYGVGEQHFMLDVTADSLLFKAKPAMDYSRIDYTRLNAFYRPDQYVSGGAAWILHLETDNFWNRSDRDALLYVGLCSSSDSSVAGTYRMASGMQVGHIFRALLYTGSINSYKEMELDDLQLSVVPGEDGSYLVCYYFVLDGFPYRGQVSLPASAVTAVVESTEDPILLTDEMAALTPSYAAGEAASASVSALSPIPYLFTGVVSAVDTSALSSEGRLAYTLLEGTRTLQGYGLSLAADSAFTDARQLLPLDTVVVLATLAVDADAHSASLDGGYIVRRRGYVPIHGLNAVSEDGHAFTLSWNPLDAGHQYLLKVSFAGQPYIDTLLSSTSFVYDFPYSGSYSWQVYSADASGEWDGRWPGVGPDFTVQTAVDYAVYDLEASVDGSRVSFTWRSQAPMFSYRVFNNKSGKELENLRDTVAVASACLSVPSKGEFTFSLVPMSEDGGLALTEPVTCTFVVTTLALDDPQTAETRPQKYISDGHLYIESYGVVYDVLGSPVTR
ncbi:MAG: C10 family peptidase [Paludibacteraceae bacterium]|nr:C10 family peptidase [Paludibacteraceae bacterium]